MHRRFMLFSSGLPALLLASTAQAQQVTSIGTSSAGTPVMLESKSVKRADGIVTATLRVELKPTIKTATGDMVSMRSIMMFDCAKKTSATKERWFYYDVKHTKEARHDKPGIPGFGSPIKGTPADVGLAHFCAPGTKKP